MLDKVAEAFSYDFVRYALMALSAGAILGGLLGPFIVMRRIGFIAGAISHALLGVVALALFFNVSPYYFSLPGAVLLAFIAGWMDRKGPRGYSDLSIALLWCVGMSIGLFVLSRIKGYVPDVMSFLFGNILLLSLRDVVLSCVICIFIGAAVLSLFNVFALFCIDEEFACVQGLPVRFMYYFLLALVAMGIVVLLKTMGIILTIAFLLLPSGIACRKSKNLRSLIVNSTLISLFTGFSGFWLAYFFDMPVSAGIVFVLAVLWVLL